MNFGALLTDFGGPPPPGGNAGATNYETRAARPVSYYKDLARKPRVIYILRGVLARIPRNLERAAPRACQITGPEHHPPPPRGQGVGGGSKRAHDIDVIARHRRDRTTYMSCDGVYVVRNPQLFSGRTSRTHTNQRLGRWSNWDRVSALNRENPPNTGWYTASELNGTASNQNVRAGSCV
jgi:hypothetical protein